MSFLRWHDLLPIRAVVDQKTRPVDEDYLLVFGDRPQNLPGQKCDTGYTDFERRRCWVNAEYLSTGTPQEQYVVTVYMAAHERAHARWTDFVAEDFALHGPDGMPLTRKGEPIGDRRLHQCWNILEDERIERLLTRDFPHLHRYLREGCRLFLGTLSEVAHTDAPFEVLKWVLRSRVATRAGVTEPCPLSPQNMGLFKQIEPLLDEAFSAVSSRDVVPIARKILEILNLTTQVVVCTQLGGQVGQRRGGDSAEEGSATAEEGTILVLVDGGGKGSGRGKAGDEEAESEANEVLKGNGFTPGSQSSRDISPAPYIDLLNSVRPMTAPLRRVFDSPPIRPREEYDTVGSRLSIRAARRTPDTPFRTEGEALRRLPIALTVVIDDSGSMTSGGNEWEAKRATMMCLEALPAPHRVRVVLAPTGRVVADRTILGDMGKARLAGYDSNSGTAYADILKREMGLLLHDQTPQHRYLILIADGLSDTHDQRMSREALARGRRSKVRALGVGVGLDESGEQFYAGIFGTQYLSIRRAEEFVPKFSVVLRRMSQVFRKRVHV